MGAVIQHRHAARVATAVVDIAAAPAADTTPVRVDSMAEAVVAASTVVEAEATPADTGKSIAA